jgi:hypothetical protein
MQRAETLGEFRYVTLMQRAETLGEFRYGSLMAKVAVVAKVAKTFGC